MESAAGSRPRQATSAVIMMGRRRISAASRVAVRMSLPSCRSLLMKETRITAVSTETPISASRPSTEDTLNGVCVSFSAISAPTGSVITHAERDRDREFEIAVEREQNHENQQQRERPDDFHLALRFEKFAVFAAPVER